MSQPKSHSALEAIAQPFIGYFVALATQLIVFPWFGINLPISSNIKIGAIFFSVSVVRSYLIRRCFNAMARPC
jgi:hypothetical protein